MNGKNINLLEALKKQGATVEPEQETFLKALEVAFNERFTESDKGYGESMKAALEEVLGAIPKDQAGKTVTFGEQLKSMAENLEKLETATRGSLSDKAKYNLKEKLKEHAIEVKEAIKNKQSFDIQFSAKAAAMFTTTSAMTNGSGVLLPLVENYLVEDDMAMIRFPENFILNFIPNRQVAVVPQQVIRPEEATQEGTVGVVAEGGEKTLISNTFIRNTTLRKKYAARIEWTEEFEIDNPNLFDLIIELFEVRVTRAYQDGIITQMIANAAGYTSSTMDDLYPIPDNGLAVIAVQSVLAGLNFTPNLVIMNPADVYPTLFAQDAEGRPLMKTYVSSNAINGIRLVISNKIAAGNALIGDTSVYREWHTDFILRFGTYDDQFIFNEKTAVGEIFTLLRIANNEKPAWRYISLATVRAALLKPAV